MTVGVLACAPLSGARFRARTPLCIGSVGCDLSLSGHVSPGEAILARVQRAPWRFFPKRPY
jgi:hypothetical protein